ncbi:hypothetical protein AX15_007806 [Amanita polypyramis BW_CC]|nr:hypothetical protein AX15_007806 [Amanita polypyramis BW_CC]
MASQLSNKLDIPIEAAFDKVESILSLSQNKPSPRLRLNSRMRTGPCNVPTITKGQQTQWHTVSFLEKLQELASLASLITSLLNKPKMDNNPRKRRIGGMKQPDLSLPNKPGNFQQSLCKVSLPASDTSEIIRWEDTPPRSFAHITDTIENPTPVALVYPPSAHAKKLGDLLIPYEEAMASMPMKQPVKIQDKPQLLSYASIVSMCSEYWQTVVKKKQVAIKKGMKPNQVFIRPKIEILKTHLLLEIYYIMYIILYTRKVNT